MHMGRDPIHTGLCTEPEEGEYVGGAGSKVRVGFEERPADGQVEMQGDIGTQAAGGRGEFSAEFLKPNFRCFCFKPFGVGELAVFCLGREHRVGHQGIVRESEGVQGSHRVCHTLFQGFRWEFVTPSSSPQMVEVIGDAVRGGAAKSKLELG